ncbi:hypothetical protein MC378_14325 [Polaribacter sp. MSW13]|uniref:Uncharacterized protein n=1 Tax=Polaribacter marinus TaxID=2916838 RepID=A0A9X2AKR2_9FLAO|nr:hypothetical protein [Polaribacter marinus]MCI2230352.1 hypothetical protein [Polaribacter marinus]
MATLYDTIKSKIIIDNLPNEFLAGELKNLKWADFLWRPIQNKNAYVIGYQTELNNIHLKLYGSELQIENSLQKFYMGNNYQDFTFSQVLTALDKLNSNLPIDIYKTTLLRADVGVVINHDTTQETDRWLDYKGTLPIPMIKGNVIYGKEIRKTNYKFKAYNKTFEAQKTTGIKLLNKLMRVELKGNNRYFNNRTNPIGLYTVQDLIDPIKYRLLANELLNFYASIKKKTNLNFSKWSTKETRLYGYMNYEDSAKAMKQHHKETHKKERGQFLKLLTKYQDTTQENIVIDKLKSKIDFSINN